MNSSYNFVISLQNTIFLPEKFAVAQGYQENTARLYITPDLIGDNQPLLQDEVSLTFSGSTRIAKITDIRTLKGGQEYLFRIDVVF